MVRKIAFLLIGVTLFLSSCTAKASQVLPPETDTPTPIITPYRTMTPKPVTPTATFVVTVPVTPAPTPTPFLHTITNDDTMLGLAFRYGVTLEALKEANPNVNPNAMTVGSQLVIPLAAETPQALATPTAVPVQVEQPRCFRSGDGGAWCVAVVRNELKTSVENLSVWIGLYNSQAENFTSQVSYAPMDIIYPGNSIPMMVYFSAPLPHEFTARSKLLTAYVVPPDDSRYIAVEVKTSQVAMSADGSQAQVTGQVLLPQDTSTVTQVWILVVAYDASGQVIGARKWKSAGETQFDTIVYSLGGPIDHVRILSEVRP